MVLRMKSFNILGIHWKIWLLGGGGLTKNQYRGGGLPKKGSLGQFANLRGTWQERGGRGWYPNAHYDNNSTQKQPPETFYKNAVLKNFAIFTGKHLCWSFFFNKVAGLQGNNFIKKETPTQAFSCEYCKNFKKSFFYGTRLVAASTQIHFTWKD